MSEKVVNQKVVTFTYSIMDEQGNIQEQSDLPMAYVHGADERVIPKIAEAMEGRSVGETIKVAVPPKEGFGEFDESLIFRDKIENVPEEYREIGKEAQFQNEDGQTKTMIVTKIENGEIELDGNHPYAGKTMTFILNIKEIRDATADEVGSGIAAQNAIPDNRKH